MAATPADPRLEPIASFEEARADWLALAEAGGNPFASYEFAAAWWRAYGGGHDLALTRVRTEPGGRTAALLPLYRVARGPLRLLRFIGHGPADRLGPVCAPQDAPLAAAALRRAVAEHAGPGGLLVAERLPGEHGLAPLLGGRELRREPSPVLPVAGRTWEEWLASRRRHLRQQIRYQERKLVKDHALAYRMTEDPARLDADFDELLRLHRLRWGGESGAFAGPREDLHRQFARGALEAGWLRLWFAEVEGRPAAAWYGFRFGGADWYYQGGRDPAWDRRSVGAVLVAHTMRCAFEDGVREYHFGLGDEPYKDRFAEADRGLVTVAVGRPRVAALAAAALRAAARLPDRPRGLITRRAA
jgi:CelD/BcsL family acetyltransferase involved in cellulose biosynthesis